MHGRDALGLDRCHKPDLVQDGVGWIGRTGGVALKAGALRSGLKLVRQQLIRRRQGHLADCIVCLGKATLLGGRLVDLCFGWLSRGASLPEDLLGASLPEDLLSHFVRNRAVNRNGDMRRCFSLLLILIRRLYLYRYICVLPILCLLKANTKLGVRLHQSFNSFPTSR